MHTRHTALAVCGGTLALMMLMGGLSYAQGVPLTAELGGFEVAGIVPKPSEYRARYIDHDRVEIPDISHIPTVKSSSSSMSSASSSLPRPPMPVTPGARDCDAVRDAIGQVLAMENDILPTHTDNADTRLLFETRLSAILTQHCGDAHDSSSAGAAAPKRAVSARCDRFMQNGLETQESFRCRVQLDRR
jgi:hypothetical protein